MSFYLTKPSNYSKILCIKKEEKNEKKFFKDICTRFLRLSFDDWMCNSFKCQNKW